MNFKSYEFSILKYVHDRITGEFINIGVILYSKEGNTILAKCKNRITRLSTTFPDFNRQHFTKLMNHITTQFDLINKSFSTELNFHQDLPLKSLLIKVLPADDSSLQWSQVSSGISPETDLHIELEHIFKRYVTKYDTHVSRDRRTEQDIWKDFEKKLKPFIPLDNFTSKKITVKDDELEFRHAWKNGIWHCIEPVSFDLADSDYLKDKAHRWLGQMTSIQNSGEDFKLYLILSKPQEENLRHAFEKAVSILNKIPIEKEIILEENSVELAEQLKTKFDHHISATH